MEHKRLKFEWHGVTFYIRGGATRGDQYEMHAKMAEHTKIEKDGSMTVSAARLHPWLIERFVTSWSVDESFTLQKLMDQPAQSGEDLILVLGSYILNHTGLAATEETAASKNA